MFAPPSPVKEEKEKVRHVLVGTLSLFFCVKSSHPLSEFFNFFKFCKFSIIFVFSYSSAYFSD
jgi:hypothetical protein